jgi:hypothetical protein
MARIDTGPQPIFHVGDNRHSPLKIVDAAVHPYLPRSDEHRKAEARIAPKRGKSAKRRLETAMSKVKVPGRG